MEKRPRFTQLCIFYWNDRILVFEGYNTKKKETFYRCIGGGLQYGESLENGLRREILEELGEGIEHIIPLGLANCIYEWEDSTRHRVYMIYDARLKNRDFYTTDDFFIEDGGEKIPAKWKKLEDFKNGDILHPYGLLDFLLKYLNNPPRHQWIIEG